MASPLFLILAGGKGERLKPLTTRTPKPLVRFGPDSRIIDFTIYNCLASGCTDLVVITQYLSEMLENYLHQRWSGAFANRDATLRTCSAKNGGSFSGTADAAYQVLSGMSELPKYVVILAGDHVYRMDYKPMIDFHIKHGDPATVAAVHCKKEDAHRFGIIRKGHADLIKQFHEKPQSLSGITPPGRSPLASMGIYVFTTSELLTYLACNRAEDSHDFGKDILPQMALDRGARVYPFSGPDGCRQYWRDVGDLSTYWQANMELLQGNYRELKVDSVTGLKRNSLSVGHYVRSYESGELRIYNSLVSDRADIGRAYIEDSVIGPGAVIKDSAVIRRSVVLDRAVVEKNAELDTTVVMPETEVSAEGRRKPASKSLGIKAGAPKSPGLRRVKHPGLRHAV